MNAVRGLSPKAGIALSAVFVFAAFTFGVFFNGFDRPHFAPALILVSATAGIALAPGFRKGWAFPSAYPAWFLFLFWGWLGFSLLWSQVPNVSIIFCLTIGAMPLLFFALTQNAEAWRFIRAGRIALIVAVSLLSAWAAAQFFFLGDLVGTRIRHPMLNPNNLAVTIVMGFFLLLPVFSAARGWRQWFAGFLIVLMIFAMLTTQSRGGSLGLLVGLLIYIGVCHRIIGARWKSFAALLLAVMAAGAAYFPMIAQRIGELHLLGGLDAAASTQGRFYLWASGLAMLRDHPLIGTGLGTFYLRFPPYRDPADLSDGFFLHADPLQFGIETGILATVLFYAFGIGVLLYTVRALRIGQPGSPARVEVACGFAGLTSLLINAHLDYDLYMLTAQMMAAFLLAAWYLGAEDLTGRARQVLRWQEKRHRVVLVPAFALLLIAAPVWVARAGLAVYFDGLAANALSADDPDLAGKYAGRALRLGPANYDRAYYIDSLWRGRILQKNMVSLDPSDRARLFEDAMKANDLALRYNPYNVPVMNNKALLYFMAYPRLDPDGIDHAREMLELAMTFDPVNFDLRMGLAKMLELQNRPGDAIDILEGGLGYQLTQRYAPAQYFVMLSELFNKTGRLDKAREYGEKAVARNQEWIADSQGRFSFERWFSEKSKKLLNR